MQNFKKFDINSINNDVFLIRRIDGDIHEVHSKILDVCRDNLIILCVSSTEEEYSYACKRVCNTTGVITEFTMEFLTFEEEHTNIIRFLHQGEEISYEFFRKTVEQITEVNDEEFLMNNNNISVVTSIFDDLTLRSLEEEWLVIARHFSTDTGLRVIKSLALTGVHVPQQILDVIVSSCKKVTLDFLICMIAIFKSCKDYTLDRRAMYNLLIDASNLDELHKHQLALLLYLWKIQGNTYGDNVIIQSEWQRTRRIIDYINQMN